MLEKIHFKNGLTDLKEEQQGNSFYKSFFKGQNFFCCFQKISTSNHMFKREIWDKFTEFIFLKF